MQLVLFLCFLALGSLSLSTLGLLKNEAWMQLPVAFLGDVGFPTEWELDSQEEGSQQESTAKGPSWKL